MYEDQEIRWNPFLVIFMQLNTGASSFKQCYTSGRDLN